MASAGFSAPRARDAAERGRRSLRASACAATPKLREKHALVTIPENQETFRSVSFLLPQARSKEQSRDLTCCSTTRSRRVRYPRESGARSEGAVACMGHARTAQPTAYRLDSSWRTRRRSARHLPREIINPVIGGKL
eukprot:3213653-Pleurochrysis_carterae.AAC.3